MTETWRCHRCRMTFLLGRPDSARDAEGTSCAECRMFFYHAGQDGCLTIRTWIDEKEMEDGVPRYQGAR